MEEKWIVEFYLVPENDTPLNIKRETSNRFLIYDIVAGSHYFENEAQAKEVLIRHLQERAGENYLPKVFEIRKIYIQKKINTPM